MCYKNTDQTGRGRPITGFEKRICTVNTRIEPCVNAKLNYLCEVLNISRSDAVRQAILIFIREAEKAMNTTT